MQWLVPSYAETPTPLKLRLFLKAFQIPLVSRDILSCITYLERRISVYELHAMKDCLRKTLYVNRLDHYRFNISSNLLWRCLVEPVKSCSYVDEPASFVIRNRGVMKRFKHIFSNLWKDAIDLRLHLRNLMNNLDINAKKYIDEDGKDLWFFLQSMSRTNICDEEEEMSDSLKWLEKEIQGSMFCPMCCLKIIYDPQPTRVRDKQIGFYRVVS